MQVAQIDLKKSEKVEYLSICDIDIDDNRKIVKDAMDQVNYTTNLEVVNLIEKSGKLYAEGIARKNSEFNFTFV